MLAASRFQDIFGTLFYPEIMLKIIFREFLQWITWIVSLQVPTYVDDLMLQTTYIFFKITHYTKFT